MTGRALPGMPPAPARAPSTGVWLVLAACGRCTRAAYCRRHYVMTAAEHAARGR